MTAPGRDDSGDRAGARYLAALRRKVAEYENGITWETTCLSCARVLDSAYAETARREQAEAREAVTAAERDDLAAQNDRLRHVLAEVLTAVRRGEVISDGDIACWYSGAGMPVPDHLMPPAGEQ